MVDASHGQGVTVGDHNVQHNTFVQNQPPPDLGALSPHRAAAKVKGLSRDDAVVALARVTAPADAAEILQVLLFDDEALAVSLLVHMNPKRAQDVVTALLSAPDWLARLPKATAAIAEFEGRNRATLGKRTTDVERVGPSPRDGAGWLQRFEHGLVYYTERLFRVSGEISRYHDRAGGVTGRLGFPVGAEHETVSSFGTTGRYQRFEGTQAYPIRVVAMWPEGRGGAAVYTSHPYGTHATWAAIGTRHEKEGGEAGWLGFPTSDEIDARRSPDEPWHCYQTFEGGAIYWKPEYDAVAVRRPIADLLAEDTRLARDLGFPTGDELASSPVKGDRIQLFEHGVVTVRNGVAEPWVRPGTPAHPVEVSMQLAADVAASRWVFAPGGALVAAAGRETVRLFDLRRGGEIELDDGGDGAVPALAFRSDGLRLAVAYGDGKVVYWTFSAEGDAVGRLVSDVPAAGLPAMSTKNVLAIAGEEVLLWNAASRRPAGEPIALPSRARSLAFSPDGATLAVGLQAGGVRLINDQGWEAAAEGLEGVGAVAFSPDGRLLAAGDDAGRVVVWDRDGRTIACPELRDGENEVLDLRFSLDGKLLASMSAGCVSLWDPVVGDPVGDPIVGVVRSLQDLMFTEDELLMLGFYYTDMDRRGTAELYRVALGRVRRAQTELRREVAGGG